MDKLIEEASHSIARQHAEFIDSSVFSFLAEKFPEGLSIDELKKRGKFVVRASHTCPPEHQFWFDEKPVLQFQQGLIGGEWKVWAERL